MSGKEKRGPSGQESSESMINVDRLLGATTTATFVLELLAILVLIGSLVGHALVVTGIWDIIKPNTDLVVFLLLVGAAIAFFIFMAFFGFFTRFHGRVRSFIVGPGVGRVITTSREGRIIISLFAMAVVFFFAASCYGYYLLWKSILIPYYGGGSSYAPIAWAALGVILACLVAQVSAAAVSRYASSLLYQLAELPTEGHHTSR